MVLEDRACVLGVLRLQALILLVCAVERAGSSCSSIGPACCPSGQWCFQGGIKPNSCEPCDGGCAECGPKCEPKDDRGTCTQCTDGSPCQLPHGQCTPHAGTCHCLVPGYGGASCDTKIDTDADNTFLGVPWDTICFCASVVPALSTPWLYIRFRRNLRQSASDAFRGLAPSPNRGGEAVVGWGGLFTFFRGIAELVSAIGLCMSLAACHKRWLFLSSFITLVVTAGLSIGLSFHTLEVVMKDSPTARSYHSKHGCLIKCIIIASCSQIESLAILRLRLCKRMVIDMPMHHAYHHFLRFCGAHHIFLDDIPQVIVSIAILATTEPGSDVCGHETRPEPETGLEQWLAALPRPFPQSQYEWAYLSIIVSGMSIVWGVVSRLNQRLIDRANRTALLGARNQGRVLV